jgi:hypothetical protein
MSKLRAAAVVLIVASFLSLPCRRQMSVRGIELSVAFSSRVLTDNLFTEVRYRFKTTSTFAPLTEDNHVETEIVVRGRTVFRDEFAPPVPASKWEPDREYTFSRRVYIPAFIDEFSAAFRGAESARLSVCLVFPSGPAPGSRLVVYERKLKFVPASDSPVIVCLSGWYPPEGEPSDSGTLWRWTGKEARVAIDNPSRDALLVIRGEAGPPEAAGRKVTVSIDGRVLEEFVLGPGPFEKRYAVSREWLGGRKDFVLAIAVDKTFVPARVVAGSTDKRELGLRISLLYFR